MKIYMSTLLLAIKVFLRFDEINASGMEGASSSSNRAEEKPFLYAVKNPKDGPPHKTVEIKGQLIEVWLDKSGRNVRKAWYMGCAIPQREYYRYFDCLIRLYIKDGLRLVAYISKNNGLIGVRAPPLPGTLSIFQAQVTQNFWSSVDPKTELPYGFEPTPSMFYIVHSELAFEVQYNMEEEKATAVSLLHQNLYSLYQLDKYYEEYVQVADIKFTVFRAQRFGDIVLAELGHISHGDKATNKLGKD